MARPRLVQEGTPIYGPGSEGTPVRVPGTDDHEMNGGDHNMAEEQQQPRRVSSLQLAAAKTSGIKLGGYPTSGTIGKQEKRNSGSYVIGVEGQQNPTSPYTTSHLKLSSFPNPSPTPTSYTVGPQNQNMDGNHQQHITMMDHEPIVTDKVSPRSYQVGQQPPHHQVYQTAPPPLYSPYQPPRRKQTAPSTVVQTTYEIGGQNDNTMNRPAPEKMVGVEDHGSKAPLIVLDGANVAHYYAQAWEGMLQNNTNRKPDPDVKGIRVATEYFVSIGMRVLVVLPQYWFQSKPGSGQWNSNIMETHEKMEILNSLQKQGRIVASPPADDDDAYALTIARREEARSLARPIGPGEGPGFVLSNDMFRDAQARDTTGVLDQWLNQGRTQEIGPGRISYAFCDMGNMDDHGDRVLDFVPNPRHPLVVWAESLHQTGGSI